MELMGVKKTLYTFTYNNNYIMTYLSQIAQSN